jgi:hypothetical protein
MTWIDRPAIGVDVAAIAPQLFAFLVAIMAGLAERLQRAEKELVYVAVVWLDVVRHRSGLRYPACMAQRAQRKLSELGSPTSNPMARAV